MRTPPDAIVITGLGPVSPIGVGLDELEAAFAGQESAIRPLEGVELPEALAARPPAAAQLADFSLSDYLESEKTYLDDVSSYLLAACALAKDGAGLEVTQGNRARIGGSFGAAYGPLASAHTFNARVAAKGARLANPLIFGHTYINTAASLAAIEWGFIGYNCIVSTGLMSGLAAICQAADAIRLGHADAMLCGGSDAISAPLIVGLAAEGRLAVGGRGMVVGEGAGVLVLESAAGAGARGRPPVGRLLGYATAAGRDVSTALAAANDRALDVAGLAPGDVSLVVSCANGLAAIDEADARLRDSAYAGVATIAPKGLQGETFAAAAGIDVALALLGLAPGEHAVVLSADWRGGAGALVLER